MQYTLPSRPHTPFCHLFLDVGSPPRTVTSPLLGAGRGPQKVAGRPGSCSSVPPGCMRSSALAAHVGGTTLSTYAESPGTVFDYVFL